jgi:putative ABC transport system permease protein
VTLSRIIWANARQRGLSSALTAMSVAVGVALAVAILVLRASVQDRFRLGYSGYDLVVGAKGSPLQLVLNIVYHLEASPGNVPYALAARLATDARVRWAAPFALGDNYEGFRVVGTTEAFLREIEPQPGQRLEFAEGRAFRFDEKELKEAMEEAARRGVASHDKKAAPRGACGHEHHPHHEAEVREAVLGATVALETGLKTGRTFVATHGLQANEDGEKHEHAPWTVVGVLRPTGTPIDRAIWINLDSFYRIEGHVLEGENRAEGAAAPVAGQVSAVAVRAKSPIAVWSLRKEINASAEAQAAVPAEEIRKLMGIVGNVDRLLFLQSVLIVVVASAGLGLAMLNSMGERRHDVAVMRALGARRGTVFGVVVGEAALVALAGGILGCALARGVLWMAAPVVVAATGFAPELLPLRWFDAAAVLGAVAIGAVAGLGPAVAAYRTDVADSLARS